MSESKPFPIFSMPMRGLLLLAGMYTVAWGAFFKWFGADLIKWLSMNQGVTVPLDFNWFGTFGLVIGIGIFLSAFYPISWMYLILIGALGKLVSAGWFYLVVIENLGWNKRTLFHMIINELFWILPLIWIFFRSLAVKKYLKTLPD